MYNLWTKLTGHSLSGMERWQGDRLWMDGKGTDTIFTRSWKPGARETERWRTEAKQVNRLWEQWILLPLGHLSFMSWTSFNMHAFLAWTTTVPVQRSLFRAKCNAMQISQPCAVHCHSCYINCHEAFCVFYLQGHSGYINIIYQYIIFFFFR